jgi:hypothetical protein
MWFMDDLRSRPANRVQLIKIYGASPESAKGRYSSADCTGIKRTKVEGNPDWRISARPPLSVQT